MFIVQKSATTRFTVDFWCLLSVFRVEESWVGTLIAGQVGFVGYTAPDTNYHIWSSSGPHNLMPSFVPHLKRDGRRIHYWISGFNVHLGDINHSNHSLDGAASNLISWSDSISCSSSLSRYSIAVALFIHSQLRDRLIVTLVLTEMALLSTFTRARGFHSPIMIFVTQGMYCLGFMRMQLKGWT
jgi:hypothetical protein